MPMGPLLGFPDSEINPKESGLVLSRRVSPSLTF